MMSEFLAWWARQLLSLVPAALRGGGAGRGDAVMLSLSAGLDQVGLVVRRRGQDGNLGRFALDATGVAALRAAIGTRRGRLAPAELRLPPGMLLDQAAVLPLAAERGLERVLRYEMDRLTPFHADDLFWTWRVERRDRSRSQLHVRLILTLQAPLLPVLGLLAKAAIHPATLRSGEVALPLARAVARPWQRRAVAVLAAACVLLALGAAAVPFLRQGREMGALDRTIASLRPAANEAETLRQRAAAASAGVDVLGAQRRRSGNVLEILSALTTALPDDTVLTDLTLNGRVVTISGQSAAAARLVAILAGDPQVLNPGFAAPVTRNDTTRTEGFTIRAEMKP